MTGQEKGDFLIDRMDRFDFMVQSQFKSLH
jgi:hypothetical protein